MLTLFPFHYPLLGFLHYFLGLLLDLCLIFIDLLSFLSSVASSETQSNPLRIL
jgi:hypothetical protein